MTIREMSRQAFVDLQGTDPRRIIHGRILETLELFSIWLLELQERKIDLNVVTRDLLLVALSLNPNAIVHVDCERRNPPHLRFQ